MGYGQILAMKYERCRKRLSERLGKLKVARNALKLGLSIEQAARITEIPVDKLLEELNKPDNSSGSQPRA
ncbi:MAG: hypothetical protein LBF83_08435 [Spirochaetaceae bacterium]|jgi:predicted transposase YdaD|nr:hypothetical protein [Spirochaetaceae bacterium]